jgi:copper chaperone NosL
MKAFLERVDRFRDIRIDLTPRALILVAVLLLFGTYLFPLWKLTLFAPQYQDGLRLSIYSWKLDGGNNGQDVREVNVLNHYIGMRDLDSAAFTEFEWMPFVVGALGLLLLRTVVMGRMGDLVDVVVLFFYFGAFSLGSFAHKLWVWGHDLSPTAPVKVPGFMPPLFGYQKIANFEVYSYPEMGTYALIAVAILLLLAVFLAARERAARPAAWGAPA